MKSAQQIIPAFAIVVYLAILQVDASYTNIIAMPLLQCCEDSSRDDSCDWRCHPASAHKHSHGDVANTLLRTINYQMIDQPGFGLMKPLHSQVLLPIALVPNTQFICFIADDWKRLTSIPLISCAWAAGEPFFAASPNSFVFDNLSLPL